MANVKVNGEPRDLSDPATVQSLLSRHGLSPERVVVELNREILRDRDLSQVSLKTGDEVEIVQFVGGG